ncbi:hypothetical protein HK102_003252 [Quaeritorhiza haematococci]|nr:hypothetical protein HK102_003252 [Quaeritorhiza haematococci]
MVQQIDRQAEALLSAGAGAEGIMTGLSSAPATLQRPVPIELEKHLKNPGLPRVNSAPSKEAPEGSPDNKKSITVLQQHLEFFDRNKDGIIYPWETYLGFRALGFNFLFCFAAVLFIHGSFAYASQDSWFPNPLFPIYIKNADRLKHGSDSGVYDTEGRFVPEKFEELFSKFDRDDKKALTFWELWDFVNAYRNIIDPTGWIASRLEWGTLYLLAAKDGMISKEVIRRQYDGTLFYQVQHELMMNKRNKKSMANIAHETISQGHPKKD